MSMRRAFVSIIIVAAISIGVVVFSLTTSGIQDSDQPASGLGVTVEPKTFFDSLCVAAKHQLEDEVVYDGSYYSIPYPNGDVPDGVGVCTDVVVRSYRELGIDLQQLIHEDMKRARAVYNRRYSTKHLDPSIDHRRTQNQETYLSRQGAELPISTDPTDYKHGDLVFWDVANGHVGVVIDEKVPGTNRPYIIHNIGRGNEKQDFLFGAEIVGHYRWSPR